jgi:hypothetical protein
MVCRRLLVRGLSCRILVVLAIVVFAFPAISFGQAAGNTTTNVNVNLNTGAGGTGLIAGVAYPVQPVGGVAIDTQGLLANVQTDALGQLAKIRAEAMQKIPAGINEFADLRKVSLRRLEAAIQECNANGKGLPDDIRYLAGLQQILYVFVYPEQKDIVLVGPGEGWKVDARGNMVGITTGRPVMLFDDLLVALRGAQAATQGGITCSIDPTAEGLAKLNQYFSAVKKTINSPQAAQAESEQIEQILGMQQINVSGVPTTSHFAQVLVAADYRMKRLGMNLDQPPKGVDLPSYIQMLPVSSKVARTPRWWMEPKYEPLLRDKEGLAWELRGANVQTVASDDTFSASGQRQKIGKASPMAQKWADNMTKQFAALSLAEPVFGELRNCMDLAVVAALIAKERLTDKAGYSMPLLMNTNNLRTAEFNTPRQVPSQSSLMKKGNNWIITASGGVAIESWVIAGQTQVSDSVAPVRAKAASTDDTKWWWN